MAPELNNASPMQKNLDQEVREMISTLTTRLGSIQRSPKPGTSNEAEEGEEQGVRIITLAGSNLGATMRGDVDDKTHTGPQGLEQEDSPSSYLVNSNFQAINNSIMLGGSYKTNDPGVHLDITDYVVDEKKGRKSRRSGGPHYSHAKRSDDNVSDGTADSDKN